MNNETSGTTFSFNNNDILLAFIMLVCGFLYWNLIKSASLGAGVTIFAFILCAVVLIYFKLADIRQTKFSLLGFFIIVLSALVFLLFDDPLLKALNFIFLTFAFIYWLSVSTGRNLEKKLSVYIIGDFYNQILQVPFRNFNCCFAAIRKVLTANQKGKTLLAGVIGLLVMLPVLAWVIQLLVQADAAFAGLIGKIQFDFSMQIIIQILLGLPVACYLYGLVYGNRYGRNTQMVTIESVDKKAAALRFVPGATVYAALTALNLIFVVYFLAQLTYLFSAFNDQLPELMSYAEYARRGFFQLCAVSGINLAVLTLSHLLIQKEKAKLFKMETAALCLLTLLLIITAFSKMIMYINYYGLTQLRVYTTWFMIVLFLIFAVVAIRQFKSFNATRAIITGFIMLFLLLSYGNVDGRIAQYNIARYQNGTLTNFEVHDLGELSTAAVPYLYDLYQNTKDDKLKTELKSVIMKTDNSETTFRDFNLQAYKAGKIKKAI